MTSSIYVGVLAGPEGGPYRVMHNLDTWHVEVSMRGYTAGNDLAVVEIPQGPWTWISETENSIIVDTTCPPTPEMPEGGRLVANGWTVVVTPSGNPPA